jgi:hypothetical protein
VSDRVKDDPIMEIVRGITPSLIDAFRTAYAKGVSVGRAEAANEISAKLVELSHGKAHFGVSSTASAESIVPLPEGDRAPQGTVKPRLLELISREKGASVREMETIGIKHNSIRGTVYSLHKEGKIERRGDRWFAVGKIEAKESSREEIPPGSQS